MAAAWRAAWPPLVVVGVVLLAWVVVRVFAVQGLPSPAFAIAQAIGEDGGRLLAATAQTAAATSLGFLASVVIGVVAGSLLSVVPLARRGLSAHPAAADGAVGRDRPDAGDLVRIRTPERGRLRLLVSLFPVVAGTVDGLQSVDPELSETLRIHGAGRTDVVVARSAQSLPSVVTGCGSPPVSR